MFGGQSVIMSDNTVYFAGATGDEVQCDKRQTFRFMGCRDDAANGELDRLYRECTELLKKEASFKAVWRKSAVSIEGDTVNLDFGKITSASLCKNLEGCTSAYVFAATAGAGIDRLLLRYERLDPAKAMILSAVGSSFVECWCDIVNEKIADGKKTRPRFSPGYGGVDLCHQREIFDFLEAEKRLGVTLTDSYFMVPVKSVTAFVGIVEE